MQCPLKKWFLGYEDGLLLAPKNVPAQKGTKIFTPHLDAIAGWQALKKDSLGRLNTNPIAPKHRRRQIFCRLIPVLACLIGRLGYNKEAATVRQIAAGQIANNSVSNKDAGANYPEDGIRRHDARW